MKDWNQIFSNIEQGLSEANLEQIFVQPLLEELGFYVPNNQEKDKQWTGNLGGQTTTVKPDYTCWKTDDKSVPPFLVVEDKRVHPSEMKNAIQEVQNQMIISSAIFGLATNGLQYQLWQRHGTICVPRTVILTLSVETIESAIDTLKNIFDKPRSALTTMFWNEKGGIGKTTITANVAATLALKGKKVLIINLDFQGDLNATFGLEPRLQYQPFITLDEVFEKIITNEPVEIERLIRTKRFEIRGAGFLRRRLIECAIDIIPGDSSFENVLGSLGRAIEIIKLFIEQELVYTYDYIFLDVAPSLRDLGIAGSIAADFLCPIIDNQSFAVDATPRVLQALENNSIFEDLEVSAPLINSIIFNPRLQNVRTVQSKKNRIEEKLRGLDINYRIYSLNNYAEIDNAAEAGLPIVFYRPGSRFAKTFDTLVCSMFGVE